MRLVNKLKDKWQLFLVRTAIGKFGADKQAEMLLQKGLIKIKEEKTKQCGHDRLKKVIKGGLWYRCTGCKMVFYVYGADGYKLQDIKMLTDELIKQLKLDKVK